MIELRNIGFSYGGREALKNINISFREGEFCAIVGRNGCGKTTLARILSAFAKPECGEILLDGKNYSEIGRKMFAEKVSYFPQSRPVPDMTVRDMVLNGRYPFGGKGLEIVDAALEMTLSADHAHRNLRELSAGERQRAYLALLFAQDSEMMILDEPGAFMDISHSVAMAGMLRAQAERGKGVVAIMHDLAQALSHCHRIVVMKDGMIIGDGTPELMVESGKIDKAFGVKCRSVYVDDKKFYTFE